jgi:uncharacterized protein (DUF169 family)
MKQQFLERWTQYFPGAELPLVLSYTDAPGSTERVQPEGWRCIICELARVRAGPSLFFDKKSVTCGGGRRYLGFVPELRPGFEHFLSCGIPGEMEGERYKKSPELVLELLARMPEFEAPARYLVAKRWDRLAPEDEPEIVVFFAPPDVLSGLFTLAGYAEPGMDAVTAPFGSGCASVVYHPYLELASAHPRAVLGMFDVSARPCVPADVLTFAVPWPKFAGMVEDMDESFLITGSWRKVQARMQTARTPGEEH